MPPVESKFNGLSLLYSNKNSQGVLTILKRFFNINTLNTLTYFYTNQQLTDYMAYKMPGRWLNINKSNHLLLDCFLEGNLH